MAKADHLLGRFGRSASIVALPIFCGVNRVPVSTFIPFSAIGRLGWVLLTGGLAYALGPEALAALKRVGVPAISAILGIALIVFVNYYLWSQRYPEAARRYKAKLDAIRDDLEEGHPGPKPEGQGT